MSSVPRASRRLLHEGDICYIAAVTGPGPHLTPVVYALDGGRLWLTTSRGSVKARAWRANPAVAGMVRRGSSAVLFRGRVRTYDALDPLTWPSAVVSAPRLAAAATRFTMKNARFFFGYAVDATHIPLAWAPPGRVFVSVELTVGQLVDVEGDEPVEGWGEWPAGGSYLSSFSVPRAAPGPEARVPGAIRRALGQSGTAALALQASLQGPGQDGAGPPLTVLPVSWRRAAGVYEATLPAWCLELAAAPGRADGALTVDRASAWRAREMRGMLLQGPAELFELPSALRGGARLRERIGDGDALVRLRPRRAVWWEGWSSGTVSAPRRAAARTG